MIRTACVPALVVALCVTSIARADTPTTSTTKDCEPPAGQNPHDDPTLASPSEPADAVAHLKTGKGALRAQDYTEAIAEFQAGAKLSAAPIFLYALGQAFRLAGQFKESIRSYTLFLDRAQPGEALRSVVECQIGNMQADLDRAAQTMPPTDLPGDDVAPVPVAARWYDDRVGLALAGGGIVLGLVGAGLLWNASTLDEEANTEDRQPVRDELRDKADSRRGWGGAVGVVGAVVLISGVVKLAITPDAPHAEPHRVALVSGPGDIGLGVVGRF